MTKKPITRRFGPKRSKSAFLIFRVAAIVVIVGVFAVFGLSIKNTLALSWSEPAVNPPDMTGINGPVWAQTAASQAGGMWVTGKGRFDTAGTADANCTGAKVCGADNGAGFGLSGESATGVGLYASTGNASSYAGDFNGNVYVYPGSKVGLGIAPSTTLDVNGIAAIGSNTPYNAGYSTDYKLHIGNPAASANGGIMVITGTSGIGKISFDYGTTADGRGRIWYYNGTDTMQFATAGGAADMTINAAGNVGIQNTSPSATLSLGTAGTSLGSLSFAGNTSGVVTVQPAAAAGTWTLTLPTSAGTSGQVLQTNGAGVTSWATVSGGGQTPWTANEVAAGYTLYGNSTASGNMTIDSTSNATKGYIILQPSGGNVGIGNSAPTASLSLGTAGTRAGTLTMAGVTSGVVTLDTLAAAGTWTFTLPASGGTANQFLQTDGAGNATWVSVCSGTCTANYMSKFGSAFAETNSIMYDSGTAIGISNTSPSALLTLGTAGTKAGTLSFAGSTSGTVTVQPAAAAGTWTLTLPTTAGTSGQQLTTDGTGILSWAAAGSGGITCGTCTTSYVPKFASASSISNSLIYDSGTAIGISNTAPSALLTLGTAGTKLGNISFAGNTSGTVTVQPAAAAGTWTLTLPTTAGTSGQYLQTNGSGVATWATVAGGGNMNCGGTCTAGYIPKFNSGTGIINSLLSDNGATVTDSGALAVAGAVSAASYSGPYGIFLSVAGYTNTSLLGVSWTGSNLYGLCPAANCDITTFYVPGNGSNPASMQLFDNGNLYVNGSSLQVGGLATLCSGCTAGYYQDAANGAYRSIVSSATTSGYYFQSNAGASTTMYVGVGGSYLGRVGIGTNSPSYTLDVAGSINSSGTGSFASYVYAYGTATGCSCIMGLNSSQGLAVSGTDSGYGVAYVHNTSGGTAVYAKTDNGSGAGVFGYNYNGANGEGVLGQATGTNGIGVYGQATGGGSAYGVYGTGPTYGLYTPNSIYAGGNLVLGAANPYINTGGSYFIAPGGAYFNSGTVYFQTVSQFRGGIQNDSAANLTIYGGTSNQTYFPGHVQVGPSIAGMSNGDMSVSRGDGSGVIYMGDANHLLYYTPAIPGYYFPNANVYVTAGYNFLGYSDRRLKTEINGLDDKQGLDAIGRLNPVSYYIKADRSLGLQYGFVAQDVQDVLPAIVRTGENGMLALNYNGLFAPMVKAIQEQQAEIEDLQRQINELKQR